MKRGVTLIELAVLMASAGLCGVLVLPVLRSLTHARENGHYSSCPSNMKQLGLGLLQYTQDYDEHLPPVALNSVASSKASPTRPYGWADALDPYTKSRQILHCPRSRSNLRPRNVSEAGITDYFFNLNLFACHTGQIASPSAAVLLCEGNDGRDLSNARYARSGIPQSWAANQDSPLYRHKEMAPGVYLLFVDGHVKFWQASPPPEMPSLVFSFHPRFKRLQSR